MVCGTEENPSITLVKSVEGIAESYHIDVEAMWRICMFRTIKELIQSQGKNRTASIIKANLDLYKENEHDEDSKA